jgi:hypothetical protein
VFYLNANAFGWPGWAAFALIVAIATVVALSSLTAMYVRLDLLTPHLKATKSHQITL